MILKLKDTAKKKKKRSLETKASFLYVCKTPGELHLPCEELGRQLQSQADNEMQQSESRGSARKNHLYQWQSLRPRRSRESKKKKSLLPRRRPSSSNETRRALRSNHSENDRSRNDARSSRDSVAVSSGARRGKVEQPQWMGIALWMCKCEAVDKAVKGGCRYATTTDSGDYRQSVMVVRNGMAGSSREADGEWSDRVTQESC